MSVLSDPVFVYVSRHRGERKERSKGHEELGGRRNENIVRDVE